MVHDVWQDALPAATPLGAHARSELDRYAAVEKVIEAMHERIDQPFALDEMARIAYLSRFYFNRVFREVTGLPPGRFHTALRIAAAKRLLMTTDLSVTEICLDVGYQSLGTFTTHFHELVGLSPRELRRLAGCSAPAAADVLRALGSANGDGGPVVEGQLSGAGADELVFIGLFRQPCPQGLPVACALVRGSGAYALRTEASGTWHVAAAAFADDDPEIGGAPSRVAVTRRPVRLAPGRRSRRDLILRPSRRTDPPVLLALPRAGGLLDAAERLAAS
jgi:AraC-like DNA-binding protein